uniref:hypothetical protein n=1 Tax=Acetatifactor sp. TaxID=1872090 RepID=UPI004056C77F
MGEFISGIAIKGKHTFQLYEAEEVEDKAAAISAECGCPVLSAYIYDGDFWGYTLYIDGEAKDEFATIPEYFEEGEAVIRQYTANLSLLSKVFSVAPSQIENYLCHWTKDLLDSDNLAYENDESPYGDPWQLIDFLETLGFAYPEVMPSKRLENQMPTLQEILEQNLPPFVEKQEQEEYTLIEKLPSAFSPDYIRHLLKEDGVQTFAFGDKTPTAIIEIIHAYCMSVKQAQQDPLCQRLSVLAAFCSFWLLPGKGWQFLEHATYEPIVLSHKKPTDIYLLRARAAITDFSKRHRALKDLNRLLELDSANAELYQAEIKKWESKEQEWLRRKF